MRTRISPVIFFLPSSRPLPEAEADGQESIVAATPTIPTGNPITMTISAKTVHGTERNAGSRATPTMQAAETKNERPSSAKGAPSRRARR